MLACLCIIAISFGSVADSGSLCGLQAVQTNKLSSFRLIERASRIVTALMTTVQLNEANHRQMFGNGSADPGGYLFTRNLEDLLLKLIEISKFMRKQTERSFLKLCGS